LVVEPFVPGQFINVGMMVDGARIKRSYSLASAPGAPAELYLVRVEDGQLTPRLFELGVGDEIELTTSGTGHFVLDEVPDSAHRLWLIATGTGLAPYVSMLREGTVQRRFETIVVVHGVRYPRDLGYREELEAWAHRGDIVYVPTATRQAAPGVLEGRLPALLRGGALEQPAPLDAEGHVMLCGNPAMIVDMAAALEERGLRKHRRRRPGHFSFEKYW
ncbi:MAG: ferredoxin--NADP reductase, partial [Myxococcota bacterium]